MPCVILLFTASLNAAAAPDSATELFGALLEKNVGTGTVDYVNIEKNHKIELRTILDAYAQVDPASLGEKPRLAYYINLYNATMIQAVVDRYNNGDFKPSDDDFKVFKDPIVRTKAGPTSLNVLENGLIRKQFGDPRIHAALVCAAASCPELIPTAYTADNLDQLLDANVKKWLSDPNRNVIDATNKTLKLSSIFNWYAVDFGGKDNLPKWVGEKLGKDLSGYRIEFLDYDWALNKK